MPITLSDAQWRKIYQFLLSCSNIYVRNEIDTRRFVEALLWVTRSGAQWRLLPTAYGNWNSIYKRFSCWCDKGIFAQMHCYFASDPDMEWLIVDTTICRAHPCAAGASKKTEVLKTKR
jgi:transposase